MLPALLPGRIVELAEEATGGTVGLYVVDIEGSNLVMLEGPAGFPARLAISSGLGPEIGEIGIAEARAEMEHALPGGVLAPLWVRCRATAVLIATQDPDDALDGLGRAVAPTFEIASGYTDVIDRARRVRPTSAAAEIQQDLLAPRMAPIRGGSVAGSLLPAYDVGGDWFDHAENPEGAWLSVADAMGKGPRAAALSAIALAALRGARRSGESLEDACQAVHDTVVAIGGPETTFLTAVVATWHAPSATLAWICCGHPPPLRIRENGAVEEMDGPRSLPLGLLAAGPRTFERAQVHLEAGDRVLFYSDGITERRTEGGRLGLPGLIAAVSGAAGDSPATIVAAVEHAVLGASDDGVSDDATQLVLGVDRQE